jgi:ABC-type cobalamin/Fe3+-siderophores transport system ATPase subunit
MLELHSVTIGQQIRSLSLTVNDGELASITGQHGSGKTMLLKAVLGLIPVDSGHISIDGELLTPQSAPYFRRQMAYVPQQLSLPEGYAEVQTDYLWLLNRAIVSGKQLLIIDEPQSHLSTEEYWEVDRLLMDAARKGMTILAVNDRITQNQIQL